MPFDKEIRDGVLNYCLRDLPDDKWYSDAFCFVKNEQLKLRLISEFKNARFTYKIFEGLSVDDELLLAEVKLQVLLYASIYEATLHYVLFDEYYKDSEIVKQMLVQSTVKQISIPPNQLELLTKFLSHDGKSIIPYYKTEQKRDITKVRFDEKCIAAFKLGVLSDIPKQNSSSADILTEIVPIPGLPTFCAELIRIYEVRNAIHLHAELKKEIEYHLELSRIAYRRMQPFLKQIKNKLSEDGLI